jgi:predicted HTH transcriptional regulator
VKILELVLENPTISIPMLAEKIGVTIKAIEKQISILKNEGALIRLGPDRGGEWQVVQKPEQ